MPADPLSSLRLPVEPVAPRPSFARALRARVVDALGLDPAVANQIDLPDRRPVMTDTSAPAPVATQIVTPYLAVHDGNAALAWYVEVFGAFETMRVTGDDGRLGHAEFTVGGARIMLSDEYPEVGVTAPPTIGGTAVMMYLEVADVDQVYERAMAGGAVSDRPPADQTHGNRTASIQDPFGHRWMLAQPIESLTLEEYAARESEGYTVTGPSLGAPPSPVELGYYTLHRPDTRQAAQFFGALFGWATEPGPSGDEYHHVSDTRLPLGFAPPVEHGEVTLFFRVDDIDPYARRVEELGGQVLLRTDYASGGNAECVDDQGFRFDLWQPAPGY